MDQFRSWGVIKVLLHACMHHSVGAYAGRCGRTSRSISAHAYQPRRHIATHIDASWNAREHSESKLSDDDVRALFERSWPFLEAEIEKARTLQVSQAQPARKIEDKIDEILTKVRQLTANRETNDNPLVSAAKAGGVTSTAIDTYLTSIGTPATKADLFAAFPALRELLEKPGDS